jgi:proline iminopeptidase
MCARVLTLLCLLGLPLGAAPLPPASLPVAEGYVDVNGVFVYYMAIGQGSPLIVLHGGPGASHDYFLPYLLPLARHARLVFVDERGSGRSSRLEDASAYTVENMADDVEGVRQALRLGEVSILGHSYGGVLAQAYALKYPTRVSRLVLCSTFASTSAMNRVFDRMKEKMDPELRARIDRLEKAGLFGRGKPFQQNRYPDEYMTAAWGEAYFPYVYRRRPNANEDPQADGNISWELYREMWGSHGEFVIDGNLKSVEYLDRLSSLKMPTLITVGDHDECDPVLAHDMHEKIAGSKLVILPESGHMTFVDQTTLFLKTVGDFLQGQ